MRALAGFGAGVVASLCATFVGLLLDVPWDWRYSLRELVWFTAFGSLLALAGILEITFPERR